MNIRIGNSFSGGLIDYLLFGVLQGKDKTNWPNVLLIGVIWFCLYFAVFTFCIKKFHVNIPGMQETKATGDKVNSATTLTQDNLTTEAGQIIDALGGRQNIKTISACATRLRIALNDNSKIDEEVFKTLGSPGILRVAGGVQAIFGAKADLYSQEINDLLSQPASEPSVVSAAKNVKQVNNSEEDGHSQCYFTAPVNGTFIPLEQVDDEVFSKKMMGEGYAIEPTSTTIYSPIEGQVVSIFATKHALGIKTAAGLEVLLHLGIDTVDLNGKPFTIKVHEGDQVTTATELAQMDLAQIKDAGKKATVIVAVTNSAEHLAKERSLVKEQAEVAAQSNVYEILLK